MKPERRTALTCSAVALGIALAGVLAVLSVNGWHLSALVRMASTDQIASLAARDDPGFVLVNTQAHYDGTYFYAIARDPFATGEAHQLIDNVVDRAPYRYGHAGYGWLAWLASAGRAKAVPGALLGVGLAGVVVGAYAASVLSRELGWSGWGGLAVALSPGIAFAITADTSEPVAVAATALALLAWRRRHWSLACVALTAACLIKEPLLAVPVGLAVWELLQWLRGEELPQLRQRLLACAVGPLALGAWFLYLHSIFGIWPFSRESNDFLTFPFAGWVDSFRRAARLTGGAFESAQIGNVSVALLAVIGGALLFGLIRAARLRSWLDPIFLLYGLLIFSLNWYGVLYPKDLIREVTVPLAVLPAVVARRPGLRRDPDGQG